MISQAERRIDMTVPLCLELVDAVRCMDRARTRSLLDLVDRPTALVVLAAMVDQDQPPAVLLDWATPRSTLGRTQPRLRRLPDVTDDARRMHADFTRCKANGLPISDEVRRGETEYQRLRGRSRRKAPTS